MIHRCLALVALAMFAGVLTGCDTTRDKSARAKVAAERELAARKSVVVRKPWADVKVTGVDVVGRGRDAAFVVRYLNEGSEALNDLPVNVGVSSGGSRTYLNRRKGLEYFLTHIAAASPGREGIWVAPLGRRVPSGKPFAVIGKPTMPQSGASEVPPVEVTGVAAARSKVTGKVKNTTGFPQYAIFVYAIGLDGDDVVAAARARPVKFSTGEEQSFSADLIGRLGKSELKTFAAPAIVATP